MTITLQEMLLYAGGMAALWAVPGPVWVALMARALSGGFGAAWPLAVGVTLGDAVWPLVAIYGLTWILSAYGGFLSLLHWVAVGTFFLMGALLLRSSAGAPTADSALTRPGRWAGFATGVAAAFGNPKAILFYMGVLPGFFDLTRLRAPDILAIIAISVMVPLLGNLALAVFLDRARSLLATPERLRRMNQISGGLLIGVAVAIALI